MNHSLILTVLGAAFVTVFVIRLSDIERKRSMSIPHAELFGDLDVNVQEAFSLWHSCMMRATAPPFHSSKLWSSLPGIVEECSATTPMRFINYTAIKNRDEHKYCILNDTYDGPSTVVTLGVGLDVLAELKLKDMLPKESKFYGADPIYDGNDKLYARVGKFFPVAIGNKTTYDEASVLSNGRYHMVPVVHLDIVSFLTKIVKTPVIDLLLMDNEGPEYEILPMMSPGRELDQNGIVICQISTEIHGDPRKNNTLRKRRLFVSVITEILHDQRYAILKDFAGFHHRTFLVNFENRICVEKYVQQFLNKIDI
ncbi:hypothetical protein Y032_0193g1391 [Ancylostoma ceylanicum]|uniref:Methyltransferase FkbM domain-containing protein n=1 Tax=Ancylostoma ceylanicum TaxID=53326 RepID=A0A016SPE7_9BILA|nr:hypothetical protein Y032_0193g1391 [Ancylostoma ceylanicum]